VYYGAHPLGHRVLGTSDTVRDMPHDRMIDYFARRYASDNTVVALGGRFDFDEMTDRLARHCGDWARGEPGRAYPAIAPRREDFTEQSAKANRHYTLMLAPGPAMDDDRRYAAGMLMSILGEGDGSRLHWALVEPGLADEAVAEYDGRDRTGQLLLFACCPPNEGGKVEAILRREAADLVDSLTEDDLVRVRSRAATAATLHGELPSGRMRRLGRVWTYMGEYRSLEAELERIGRVTLDELRAVAESFPCEPLVVGRLRPGPERVAGPGPGPGQGQV
jgi:predicted Zn-dependent peptidase